MKALLSSSLFVSLFFGLVAMPLAEASQRTYYFRPRSSADYESFKQQQQAQSNTTGVRRSWGRRTATTGQGASSTSTTASSSNTARYTSRIRLRSSYTATKYSSTQLTTNFDQHEAINAAFGIELPEGFIVLSDTLTESSGKISFRKGDTFVDVEATATRCEGGSNALVYCLKDKAINRFKTVQSVYYRPELIQNEQRQLRDNSVQQIKNLQSTSFGWWMMLSSSGTRAGQLAFFEPTNKNIWYLTITAPEGEGQLLNDRQDLNTVIGSLFAVEKVAARTNTQQLLNLIGNRRSTDSTRRSKDPYKYDAEVTNDFTAENVQFSLTLPTGFVKQSDTLTESGGEMLFENTLGGVVKVFPTQSMCDSQTRSLVLRCLDEFAVQQQKEKKDQLEGYSLLRDENVLLQLTNQGNSKEHLGRMITYRTGGKRIAFVTFVAPLSAPYLWEVYVESSEKTGALLMDSQLQKKLLSSLSFEMLENEVDERSDGQRYSPRPYSRYNLAP